MVLRMGMPWSPSNCTGNDFLRDACRTEKLSNACISVSEKPVRLSVGCTTQGVLGVRGHRNLKIMCFMNSSSSQRQARGLYPPPQM
ncbi:hypothetical protein TNIN_96871 [Trichonephila inaurata madagascariensis]|uniref:Uncharacterized protein n=1 Tax=Trichonephila inaurata madagascariensis TaxID=2747483 RepID=A0A8X7CGJ6_9ARAC|nr:hypothetical protein TNIN_96871 [Trichonephila inaurata madagascariensis]